MGTGIGTGMDMDMGLGSGSGDQSGGWGMGSQPNSNEPVVMTFSMRPSPADHSLLVVHADEQPVDAVPIFSSLTRALEPNITLYQGNPSNVGVLGTGNFGETNELVLRGRPVAVKKNIMGDHYSVQGSMGEFRWKRDLMGVSSALDLVDASGRRLARMAKAHAGAGGLLSHGDDMKLDFYVRPDDYLIEMVVLTALVVKVIHKEDKKGENKAAMKILAHVIAGA